MASVVVTPTLSRAQSPKLSIVRDAETEELLRDYSGPIFRAAAINARATKIILVNDRSFNAFVANGQKIFMNVGALMDADTPNEVIGVMAHEAGHIAGGHLARLREQMANAQILSVAGMLLGAGAAVGAATSGGRVGNAGTGAGGIFGGSQELVRRNLLSYQRSEEQAADQSAIRYLAATGQSPNGMLITFRRFADSGLFRTRSVDPYLVSHPLPDERVAQLETLARQSPHFNAKDPPALQQRHDLMRAKLFGFVERPETVLRRYPPHNASVPARYARAVVAYKGGRSGEALSLVEGLIQGQPNYAYFHELKGQALLESGRAREAIAPLAPRRVARPERRCRSERCSATHSWRAATTGILDEAIRELSTPRSANRKGRKPSAISQRLWPQGQYRPGGARLGAGLRERGRLQDGAHTGEPRHGPSSRPVRPATSRPKTFLTPARRHELTPPLPRRGFFMPLLAASGPPRWPARSRSCRRSPRADRPPSPRAARRDRRDRARIPDQEPRGAAGGDGGARAAPEPRARKRRSLGAARLARGASELAARHRGRQRLRRCHLGRVLRLQLRLLQTRARRCAHPGQGGPEARVVLKDFPCSGRNRSKPRACRSQPSSRSRAKSCSTFTPGSWRPRPGERRARACGRQGNGPRHRETAEGHGGAEVRAALQENVKLGDQLGLSGTPAFIVGEEIISARSGSNP
jgi:predicted Zn-dependent protease